MSGLGDLLKIDLGRLNQLTASAGTAHEASASLAGTNPLDLLGEAGTLIRSIEDFASHPANLPGSLTDALGSLSSIVPIPDTGLIGEIVSVFALLKTRLGPLQDLAGLDPAAMMNKAMQSTGGLDGIVQSIVGQVADGILSDIPPALAVPFQAVRDLAAGTPQSGQEVARFFARFALGLDLDAIHGPFAILDELHDQAASCGGDLSALEARLLALTQLADQAVAELGGETPDMAGIAGRLRAAKADFDDLTGSVLPAALTRLAGDLSAIDPGPIARRLDESLAPLLARVPVPPGGIEDFFLPPLQAMVSGLDALTAQTLTDVFTEIEQEIHDIFAGSDVAVLRQAAADLLSGVVALLNDLPLVSLRNKLTQALLGIEGQVGHLADFSPVQDVAAQVQTITDAIDGIDLSAVTGKIQALKDTLQHVADNFPINDIKTELESLLGAANNAVSGLPPLIDDLKQQVDALAQQITHIDLDQAAQQAVGLVHDLRGHVNEALGSGDIPDALKAPIGALAGEVKGIDLSAEIDKPLDALVAKIDVASVLAPVQKGLDDAKAALLKLSPAALIQELDKPFNDMVAALETVSPAALIGQLSAGFKTAAAQIDHLDPRTLIQPLQDEFDKLLATMRHAADPAPLLAPLRSAYQELQHVLDAADPSKLLGRAIGQISRLPGAIGDAASGAISQRVAGGEILPAGSANLFKFGDIVRPFAALINEAKAVVHRAEDTVLADGLAALSAPLALLTQASHTAGGHLAHIGDTLAARRGLVDPTAPLGALPELRGALERLARVEAGFSLAGRGSAELNAAVVAIQLDAHLVASAPDVSRLTQASDAVLGGMRTPAVGRAFAALGHGLADFVPASLALPDTQATIAARIDAVFAALDLQPVADELDTLGDAVMAKLQSLATDIARALIRLWNAVFDNLLPVTPQGFLDVVSQAFDAVRQQLAVLDPAQLEAELGGILDAVVGALEAYSPAAFAATLSGTFQALKDKLAALDPAALLGDLNPLQGVIDQFKTLKPSDLLAPLAAQAQAVDQALARLLDLDLTTIVTDAIANLKAEIESVIQQIEAELDGLLGDLQAAGDGGGAAVSV